MLLLILILTIVLSIILLCFCAFILCIITEDGREMLLMFGIGKCHLNY